VVIIRIIIEGIKVTEATGVTEERMEKLVQPVQQVQLAP
jgi:hypothetical protein